MTLKHKSIIISIGTNISLILSFIGILYGVTLVKYQEIENQRVERNIRRISAILDDRFYQLSSKLSDWTNWDDTYKYLQDKNNAYASSNLIPENFKDIGVDEALFIDKKGSLVYASSSVQDKLDGIDTVNDLFSNFATGSALLKINQETGYNSGIIKTAKGLLLFSLREVYKSDQSGPTMGMVVFGKYLDKGVLNSVRELTQFEANMVLWDDPQLSSDYLDAKNGYAKGNKQLTKVLNNNTVSGYLVVEDVYGKPQAIVRSDISRDIYLQGKSNTNLLIWVLVAIVSLNALAFNWVIIKDVLRKISFMAVDVDSLSKSKEETARLKTGIISDEVDSLRRDINTMLDSLHKSKTELSAEKQKGESLVDLISAIVVTLDSEGKVITINKYGLETLGYELKEVQGKDWFETFIPEASRKSINLHFKELISGNLEDNAHIDNDVLTKDGKIILVSWHNTLVKDQSGKVISTISLGEDVTAEKQEEKKKETYAKELERLNELMVNRELKMIALKEELEKNKK